MSHSALCWTKRRSVPQIIEYLLNHIDRLEERLAVLENIHDIEPAPDPNNQTDPLNYSEMFTDMVGDNNGNP